MGYWNIALSVGYVPLALVEAIKLAAFVIVVMVVVFLAIAFQFLVVHELFGSGDSDAHEQQTNCPACGARVSVEASTCDYCDEPINR